jgi:TonB-dependent receptor
MNTLNFGQDVTLIAGVRVETEYNDYGSKYSPNGLSGFPTVAGTLKDTTAFYNETIWLPNAHLSIKPFDFMTVRIAAYRALARPDFNDRLEIFVAQNEGSTVQRGDLNPNLTVGNSQLPDAKAWNYEISTSFFGNTIGLLTISAYYKDIKDMFHLTDNLPVDGSNGQAYLDSVGLHWKNVFGGASYYITYPYSSSGSTHVWGFEIEHQMNTNFLPGLLSNFVLSYNVSLVRSETSIRSSVTGTRSDTTYSLRDPGHLHPTVTTTQFQKYIDLKEKLEGQPEFFGNVAIGYDIGGFSARASLFFQGEYTKIYSSDGRNDVIANSLSRWDLSIKQQIASSISVMLNINNVTNAEESTYIKNRVTGWNLPYTSNNYGVTADLGIQITI